MQDAVFQALRSSNGAFVAASTAPYEALSPVFDGEITAAAIAPASSTATIAEASALLTKMADCGDLPPGRVAAARTTLFYLTLWKVRSPTEISDGTDGDLSLIWLVDGLAASLSFTTDEVLGYSFKPGMPKPWQFEGHTIGVRDLNTFVRTVGLIPG
jgi:hypothetical protein